MSYKLRHCGHVPALQPGDLHSHDQHAGQRLLRTDGVLRVQGAVGRPQPVEGGCGMVWQWVGWGVAVVKGMWMGSGCGGGP